MRDGRSGGTFDEAVVPGVRMEAPLDIAKVIEIELFWKSKVASSCSRS